MRPSLKLTADESVVRRYRTAYETDRYFGPLKKRAETERDSDLKFRAYRVSEQGLLLFRDPDERMRLCVPASERQELLREVHDSAHEGAHAGWERTLARLRTRFYWPTMRQDVINYVKTCDPCQKIKHDRRAL